MIINEDFFDDIEPDVIINIVDATNLSRSLFFSTQLLDLSIPVVIALNKNDINVVKLDELLKETKTEKEHVEKPKLTKRERKLCELFDGGWIVRDELGRLEYHQDYPHKSGKTWHSSSDCFFFSNFGKAVGATFDFIDCLEPWSIEKLLKLEVEEE